MKICSTCKEVKPLEEFNERADRPDGRQYFCRSCNSDKGRKWHSENSDRAYTTGSAYELANTDRIAERRRASRQRDKEAVFAHYGAACACCSESTPQFLTVDHIENDGVEHRREVAGYRIYWWLVRNSFPEGFQLLCWNCNAGKELNGGICPHRGGPGPLRRKAPGPRRGQRRKVAT